MRWCTTLYTALGGRTKPWSLFRDFRYFKNTIPRVKLASQPEMLLIWSSSFAHLLEAAAGSMARSGGTSAKGRQKLKRISMGALSVKRMIEIATRAAPPATQPTAAPQPLLRTSMVSFASRSAGASTSVRHRSSSIAALDFSSRRASVRAARVAAVTGAAIKIVATFRESHQCTAVTRNVKSQAMVTTASMMLSGHDH